MYKYAYANNDGGAWCQKMNVMDIEEENTCAGCPYRDECMEEEKKEN